MLACPLQDARVDPVRARWAVEVLTGSRAAASALPILRDVDAAFTPASAVAGAVRRAQRRDLARRLLGFGPRHVDLRNQASVGREAVAAAFQALPAAARVALVLADGCGAGRGAAPAGGRSLRASRARVRAAIGLPPPGDDDCDVIVGAALRGLRVTLAPAPVHLPPRRDVHLVSG